jgi:hypothetical protein
MINIKNDIQAGIGPLKNLVFVNIAGANCLSVLH